MHSRYKINMTSQNQQMFINYITRHPLLQPRWLTWNHLLSKLIMLHLHRLLQPLVLLQRPKMHPAKHHWIVRPEIYRSLQQIDVWHIYNKDPAFQQNYVFLTAFDAWSVINQTNCNKLSSPPLKKFLKSYTALNMY